MSQRVKVSYTRTGRTVASSITSGSAVLGVFALLLSACGGGGSKIAATAVQPAASTPAVTVVVIPNPKLGTILANSKGMVLYTYTADKTGKIACTATCLTYWPPLLLHPGAKAAVAGPGVSGLGTVIRPEGVQVTYQGHPLYTYVADTKQNPIAGQDVVDGAGKWIVVVTSPVATTPSKTAPTTAKSVVTTVPPTVPPITPAPVTSPPPPPAPMSRATVPPPPPPTTPHTTVPPPPPPTTPRATVPPPPPPTTPQTTPPTSPPTTVPPGGPSY
jgi:predicted lipoprotein with Yx(FWY)xxD motif